MITSLAARELSLCPIRIAMLMLHLKEISNGTINANVAFSVLGLCDRVERNTYLLSTFSEEKKMCMEMLETKDGKQQMCALRAMRGKDMCSFHMRDLKFKGRTLVSRMECKKSIYIFRVVNSDMAKVGYSSDVENRRSAVQTGCPMKIYVEFSAFVDDAQRYENAIKAHLKHQGKHIHGEWFRLTQPVDTTLLFRECGLE